jgi:CHAD domain-containing protein
VLEEERKYEVDPSFTVPDLAGCLPPDGRVVPRPAVTLRATYYDTPDRRLARAGLSLRYRRGELSTDGPATQWTVKLPTAATGVRKEVSRPGAAGRIPAELVELLTAYHRGDPLEAAATMRTVRRTYELRDAQDQILAEIADDTVNVLDGRRVTMTFREIEVERRAGGGKLLDKVESRLRKAGATTGVFTPKHVRALGAAASEPPDLVAPQRLPDKATAGEVVTAALRHDIGRIIAHDPWVRLRLPLPDGDTSVHQMRVGCRRLRSDLRSFGPLLQAPWADGLREDLKWLAEALGAARDAEVLRARLWRTAGADPVAPVDDAALARIEADLAGRHEEALQALDKVLRSDRYLNLVEALIDAARAPRLSEAAGSAPTKVLPGLVRKPWRRLVHGRDGEPAAGQLDQTSADADWHAVRIHGKRARYAADAVAGALGGAAKELASALADVQELLGEHQDAAVAADTWLTIARSDPDDHALAVTAGRLYERERAKVREMRGRFPQAWRAATRRRLTKWLP